MSKEIAILCSAVGIVLILIGLGTFYVSIQAGGLTVEGTIIIIISLGLGAICLGLFAIIKLMSNEDKT